MAETLYSPDALFLFYFINISVYEVGGKFSNIVSICAVQFS
jgi:hypothetical protein